MINYFKNPCLPDNRNMSATSVACTLKLHFPQFLVGRKISCWSWTFRSWDTLVLLPWQAGDRPCCLLPVGGRTPVFVPRLLWVGRGRSSASSLGPQGWRLAGRSFNFNYLFIFFIFSFFNLEIKPRASQGFSFPISICIFWLVPVVSGPGSCTSDRAVYCACCFSLDVLFPDFLLLRQVLTQAGLELSTLLSLLPKDWSYRCATSDGCVFCNFSLWISV